MLQISALLLAILYAQLTFSFTVITNISLLNASIIAFGIVVFISILIHQKQIRQNYYNFSKVIKLDNKILIKLITILIFFLVGFSTIMLSYFITKAVEHIPTLVYTINAFLIIMLNIKSSTHNSYGVNDKLKTLDNNSKID